MVGDTTWDCQAAAARRGAHDRRAHRRLQRGRAARRGRRGRVRVGRDAARAPRRGARARLSPWRSERPRAGGLAVVGRGVVMSVLPNQGDTRTTSSSRGPWTPSTRSSSMSEVADGPGDERERPAARPGEPAIASGTEATTGRLDDADVEVGDERQRAPAGRAAAVEDDRAGLGDRQRAAGEHAVERVELGAARARSSTTSSTPRSPAGRPARHREPTRPARAQRGDRRRARRARRGGRWRGTRRRARRTARSVAGGAGAPAPR